jgi:hypothetical protein
MMRDITQQQNPDGNDEIPEDFNQRKGGFLDRAKVNPVPAATNNVVLPAGNIKTIKNMKALPTLANKGGLPTVKKLTAEGISPVKKPQ